MIRLKRRIFIFLLAISSLLAVYFMTRNFLLHKAMEIVSKRLKSEKQIELSVAEASCTGFSGIVMRNVILVPEKQDTLFKADSVYVCVSLFSLVTGKIRLKEAEVINAHISFVCRNGTCNFDWLKAQKKVRDSVHSEINYGRLVSRLVDKIYNFTPQRAVFKNILISYRENNQVEQLYITSYFSTKDKLNGAFVNPKNHSGWKLTGEFSQRKHTFNVKVFPEDGMRFTVPFIQSLFGLECGFETLHGILREHEVSGKRGQVFRESECHRFFRSSP